MGEGKGKLFHPYITRIKSDNGWRGAIKKGSNHSFELLLIGHAIDWIDEIKSGFELKKLISLTGPEGHQVPFEFLGFDNQEFKGPINIDQILEGYAPNNKIVEPLKKVTINFISPYCTKFQGKIITDPNRMDFEVFLASIYERIKGLAENHCGFNGIVPDKNQFLISATNIENNPHEDFRFVSNKAIKESANGKKEEEKIGGLKGRITFKGELTEYLPMIILGEELHIGKDTTQGLGRYKIMDMT